MKNVVIYSLTACSVCKAAKNYFKENNIKFEERNINKDKSHIDFMVENGYMSVPIIVIGDTKIVGFDKEKIEKELNK